MPEYLSILREASVNSIYALFILVVIFLIFKGRIKEHEFVILYYVWLPLAVITQILMTYYRLHLEKSNLQIMNIYLMFEFIILTIILLQIRKKVKGIKSNYKIWSIIFLVGILIHFIYDMNTIHNAAMLYIAVIYFNLTVSFIDLNKVEDLFKNPYSLLNITIFVKAFGYSYFLIYQTDYRFPLSVYSGVNLMVQMMFAATLFHYYQYKKSSV
jgi:hypothetical protein